MPMLDLTLPKGALSRNAQCRLADHLTCTTPRWEEPVDRENTLRVWWIIRKIQDGFWGSAGQIVGLGQIASFIYDAPERGRAFAKERLAALQQVVR